MSDFDPKDSSNHGSTPKPAAATRLSLTRETLRVLRVRTGVRTAGGGGGGGGGGCGYESGCEPSKTQHV